MAVDHNHKNGRIRGLLCKRCNGVLARMKDDASALCTAGVYVYGYGYVDADGAVVNSVLERQPVAP